MAENIIGKFVIELDENDRKLLERFANAVELMQPPPAEPYEPCPFNTSAIEKAMNEEFMNGRFLCRRTQRQT